MTRGVRKSSQLKEERKREAPFMSEGETEYAWVTQVLGNYRLKVVTMNKEEKQALIRGNMRKREWVSMGDLVLVSLRDFEENKVDVVFRYSDADIRNLRKSGERVIDYDIMRGRFCEDVPEEHEVVFQEEPLPEEVSKPPLNPDGDWLDLDAI